MATTPTSTQLKRYGPATIGGHATLQQGDQHVSNHFHITTAHFNLRHEPTYSPSSAATCAQRSLEDDSGRTCTCSVNEQRRGYNIGEGKEHERRATLLAPRTASEAAAAAATTSMLRPFQNINVDTAFDLKRRPEHVAEYRNDQSMPRIVEKISCALQTPEIARVISKLPLFKWPERTLSDLSSDCPENTLTVGANVRTSLHELGALCILLLSFLAYRNVTAKEMSKILTRFQQDQTLPVLTLLLGFGIARYVYFGHLGRSLSGLAGDCIIFEDAFRKQRSIPMSTCEHFSILKSFLEIHYQGTTGELFTKSGQFNLTIGSRRGLAIRATDWSIKGRIKPNTRVIMAVYLITDDIRCRTCQMNLIVSQMGEFCCKNCRRYYRDCDTLKYLAEIVAPKKAESRSEQVSQLLSTAQLPNDHQAPDEIGEEYTTGGLLNVDLRISASQSIRNHIGGSRVVVTGSISSKELLPLMGTFGKVEMVQSMIYPELRGRSKILSVLFCDRPPAPGMPGITAQMAADCAWKAGRNGLNFGSRAIQIQLDNDNCDVARGLAEAQTAEYTAVSCQDDKRRRNNVEAYRPGLSEQSDTEEDYDDENDSDEDEDDSDAQTHDEESSDLHTEGASSHDEEEDDFWIPQASPDVSAGSISTHSTRHQCCPPGPVYEPIPSTWNSRNDGKRKKNARFEIRKERSSQTIDALIMASTVENETKEPKQQKHLLPDRQTAPDARHQKKVQTKNFKQEKKFLHRE